MPQNLLTIDMITNKTAMVLENELVVSRNVTRQYDPSFAVNGAKIGSTLRIRLPDRVTVSRGAALDAKPINEQETTLPISEQFQIAFDYTSADLTLSLDEFADRRIKPRASQMAAEIDLWLCQEAYKQIYQSVGTPGTTPGTSRVLLQGQQKLNEAAAGRSPRYCTVNPAAEAELVEGMKGFFNQQSAIDRQFRTGTVGTNIYGYEEVNMSQSIPNHTNGDWGTGITVTSTVSTEGSTTLGISFTGSSKTWNVGDVFTVANVYSVNPQTRESTGSLQNFVVTAAASGSSTATLTVSPAMYTASNALATINAFPQANAVVTMQGSAATGYAQNLIYHRDAITLATADLELPNGVDFARRTQHNGISMRMVRAYDITNDRMICRMDVLAGMKVVRPEMAVRLWG